MLDDGHNGSVSKSAAGEGAAPGVLIPVRYLINGKTIAQEQVDAVTYYHVELPAHAVIFAEGLPCESYLDTGNRSDFANGRPAVTTHPNSRMPSDAPRPVRRNCAVVKRSAHCNTASQFAQ